MKQKGKGLIAFFLALFLLCQPMMESAAFTGVPAKNGSHQMSYTTTGQGSDTVLVIDISGSMNGRPLEVAKEAAANFCREVLQNNSARIALVLYDDDIMYSDFETNAEGLVNYIYQLRAGGATNIYDALYQAEDLLNGSNASVKNIVLLSDGLPNRSYTTDRGPYSSSDSWAYANANACIELRDQMSRDINIYTYGFFHNSSVEDAAFGQRFLRDLATRNYYQTENVEDLIEDFKITTKDVIYQTVTPESGSLFHYISPANYFKQYSIVYTPLDLTSWKASYDYMKELLGQWPARMNDYSFLDLIYLLGERSLGHGTRFNAGGKSYVLLNASTLGEYIRALNDGYTQMLTLYNQSNVRRYRKLRRDLTIYSDTRYPVDFLVSKDLLSLDFDALVIETPYARIRFTKEDLQREWKAGDFKINIQPVDSEGKTVGAKLNFGRKISIKPVLSIKSFGGDLASIGMTNDRNQLIGGKFDPTVEMFSAKIDGSGIYKLRVVDYKFNDLQSLPKDQASAILELAAKGIVSPNKNGFFNPNEKLTRAQVSALLVRTLSKMDPSAKASFKDVVPKLWYYKDVASAEKYGIIKGFPDNTFRGNDPVRKDQMTAMISRTLQQEMLFEPYIDTVSLNVFKDRHTVPKWAEKDIALAVDNQLVITGSGLFRGNENITRAEAALMIKLLLDKLWY